MTVNSHFRVAETPVVLADIYQPDVNLAIWQRTLINPIRRYSQQLIQRHHALQLRLITSLKEMDAALNELLPEYFGKQALVADISRLAQMYADLFDLQQIGLRLSVLDTTMCPRFHTDRLACRLVTTYEGQGSEWLLEDYVDRSKLGLGANGLPDHASGIYTAHQGIQNLSMGDVALLKGDGWNLGHMQGIVHRSPMLDVGEKRLLLTLDFA